MAERTARDSGSAYECEVAMLETGGCELVYSKGNWMESSEGRIDEQNVLRELGGSSVHLTAVVARAGWQISSTPAM